MKKGIRSLVVFIGIVVLTGCNNLKPEDLEKVSDTNSTSAVKNSKDTKKEGTEIFPPNLSTEEEIEAYLVGEWTCKIEYMSNVVASMKIDDNLNLKLSFYDEFTNKSKGEYKGKIVFDRLYAKTDEVPDLISLELDDEEYSKVDYFFLHRTIYDEKRVMSLFFAGNGNSIFNILTGDEDYDHSYPIQEVMFEKITGEKLQGKPRKDDKFYAVFWGHGNQYESIWLDDVDWTPPGEDDFTTAYPWQMIAYENHKNESILYNVDQDNKFEILGDDMFKGGVYYVETDESGTIVELISAEYKRYLEEGGDEDWEESWYENIDPEIKELIIDIILNDIVEIGEYLDMGMNILISGETTIIDGEECYDLALGTNHEGYFTREIHYTVNIYTRQVYKLDILENEWEPVAVG